MRQQRLDDAVRGRAHDGAVFDRIAEVYKELVEKPLIEEGKQAMPWSARMVHAHFTHHVLDPKAIFRQKIRHLKALADSLEAGLLVETESGHVRADLRQIKAYHDTLAQLKSWMATDVNKFADIA